MPVDQNTRPASPEMADEEREVIIDELRAAMEWTDATLYNNFAITVGLPVLSQSEAAAMTRAARAEKVDRIRREIGATNAD